jgi:hypothetical protein
MSNITIRNTTSIPSLVIVTRSGTLTGRLPVNARGTVTMPTSNSYTVEASVTMDDGNTFTSGPVSFSNNSQDLTAEVKQENGTFVFRLVPAAGTNPAGINLHNHTKYPVTFAASMDNNPLSAITVADAYNRGFMSTRQHYSFKSIVDGVTSEVIETTNVDAIVDIYQDNEQVADFAGYSLRFAS